MRRPRLRPSLGRAMTERLAVWSSRRPWLTLAGWAVALVAAIAITAAFVGDALSGDEEITSDTDSQAGRRAAVGAVCGRAGRARRHRGDRGSLGDGDASMSRAFERRVQALAADVRAAGAEQVTTFYDSGERRLVSGDRDATGMLVALGRDAEDDIEDVVDAVRAADGRDGFDVAITGEHTLDADFDTLAGEDLRNGELGFGLPVALIVLLLVFGSVVAGLVPLLLAIDLDHGRAGAAGAGRAGVPAVGVRDQHADRDGAGAGDRLLAVRALALSRGAPSRARAAGGDRRGRRHGQSGGAVQRDRVHAGHGRAAAGPEHDHAQPGRRGDRRRGGLGGRRPDACCRRC